MTSTQVAAALSLAAVMAGSASAHVAVAALRAVAGERGDASLAPLPPSRHLVQAERAFRAFHLATRAEHWTRAPRMGACGAAALTKDERRLLRALAAAQAGDAVLLDNYLYKLALDRERRACLTEAVAALAEALLGSGFAVPVSGEGGWLNASAAMPSGSLGILWPCAGGQEL